MRNKTKQAIIWSYSKQITKSLWQVMLNLVLMRLIAPAIFGQVAMVAVVVGFLEMFKSLGTEISLVQKSNLNENEKTSLFWFNGGVGVLFGLILIGISPLISVFYNEPSLKFISIWFAICLLINGFNTIPFALLQKELDFKKLFIIEVTTLLFSSLICLGLAIMGYHLEALLTRIILMALLPFGFCFFIYDRALGFRFTFKDIIPHLRFGMPVVGDSILNYGVRNLDNLLIGKYLGKSELGLYSRSYALLLFPLSTISSTVSNIVLPVFSENKHDLNYIRSSYLKITRMLSLVTFPLMLFVLLAAPDLVSVFLGVNWTGTVPLIQVFSVLGAVQSIGTLDGAVFQSLGKTTLQFKVGIFTKTFMMGMIVLGFLLYGTVLAMAVFYAVASILSVLIGWRFLAPLFNSSLQEVLMNLLPTTLMGLFSCLLLNFANIFFPTTGISALFLKFVAVLALFYSTGWTFFPMTMNEGCLTIKSVLCKS